MGQAKLFDQALQALGFFQGVQVFALDVFNQRHGGGRLIRHIAHQHGHRVQPRQARGAKAALARNDFVFAGVLALGQLADQDRLHDALRFDALGQFVQGTLIHAGARLIGSRHQL